MTNKIFLTSAIAMGFVAPVMAEPTNTANSFPSNGLMAEDTTYTNAATSTNMAGVTEGSVNAVAEYENILYQIAAGQYLPANSESPIRCDQNGYYCAGIPNGVNYSSSAQGLTQCPTGYANSDTGASANTNCYRACNISNMGANGSIANIAHAASLTGNDYYGNGTDTCQPSSCVNGYHIRPNITRADAIALYNQMIIAQGIDPNEVPQSYIESEIDNIFDNWESLPAETKGQIISAIAMYSGNSNIPFLQSYSDLYDECHEDSGRISVNGFYYVKELNGIEKCKTTSELYTIMLSGTNEVDCNVVAQQNAQFATFRQNAQNGDWFFIVPSKNISMSGHSRCVSEYTNTPCQVAISTINNYVTNYESYNDDMCVDPWSTHHDENDRCEDHCAERNAKYSIFAPMIVANADKMINNGINLDGLTQVTSSILSLFGSIDYMCDGNAITINWTDADSEDITTNNAGKARYGEDVRTPVKATTKPGQRFKGWRFVNPTSVQVGN